MNETKELYFFGILLPDHLAENVISIQNHFCKNYDSCKALNSPPHITIIPPFYADSILIRTIEENIEKLTKEITPFEIKLNGFGVFDKKVIYIDVEKLEALDQVEKKFSDFFKSIGLGNKSANALFHPHVTLAFRDLTRENFKNAWPLYKNKPFAATFSVTTLHLFKHQHKIWKVDLVFHSI